MTASQTLAYENLGWPSILKLLPRFKQETMQEVQGSGDYSFVVPDFFKATDTIYTGKRTRLAGRQWTLTTINAKRTKPDTYPNTMEISWLEHGDRKPLRYFSLVIEEGSGDEVVGFMGSRSLGLAGRILVYHICAELE